MTGRAHGFLDTNVLILRRNIDHAKPPDIPSISTITLAELSRGPHHTSDSAEQTRRLDVLQRTEAEFDPLPFDAESALVFGRTSAAVLACGRAHTQPGRQHRGRQSTRASSRDCTTWSRYAG